jgi:hypothetical protein
LNLREDGEHAHQDAEPEDRERRGF